jgi:ectoine hydroxylase-related dioxygenase (phytanoyl-CoA dioxygenase family)
VTTSTPTQTQTDTDLETARDLLGTIGVRPLADEAAARLDADGYTMVRDVLTPDQLDAVRTRIDDLLVEAPRRNPMWRPRETLHLDGLLDEGAEFDPVWTSPKILGPTAHLLGPDFWATGLGYRAPSPGHGRQDLHRTFEPDTEGGPVRHGQVTAIVALVDFTPANGATQVITGSHRSRRRAAEHRDPEPVACPAGGAIVFTEHLLHSGTTNTSDTRRDALIVRYDRRGITTGYHAFEVTTETVDRLGDLALLLVP